jgi:hypothetical protein
MMAFDFPNSPAVGQKYPASPVGGQPTYTWDGEKWTTVGGTIAGKTAVWTDGSSAMTAQLTLIAPPVNPTHAVAKSYADAGDASKVSKAGDTMTGGLVINQPQYSQFLKFYDTTTGYQKYLRMGAANVLEFVNNANTNVIASLTDAGGFYVSGSFAAGYSGTTGNYYFGDPANGKYIGYDGASYHFVGAVGSGSHIFDGDLRTSRGGTDAGVVYFGSAGARYLYWDGSNWTLAGGGSLNMSASISCGNITSGSINSNGRYCRQGLGGAVSNIFNLYWTGAAMQVWIDSTNIGNMSVVSDYRTKKDVVDLPGMWDTVKALRPIKYTQADFSPPSHVSYIEEQKAKAEADAAEGKEATEVNDAPLFAADDIERWGFIAHELQDTLIESAASGVKDAPDTVQSPNPFTLIAVLTKALQEAMARIEALEALG